MKAPYVMLAIVLSAVVVGCAPRHKEPEPQTLEPIPINWNNPGSVVEGFFDAKKRGDWRKAFDCCDFKERLGGEEAKKIRAEWKRDAPTWPNRYRDSQWVILDETIRGNHALVSVILIEGEGNSVDDLKRSGFDELLKRYGKRWKITEFPRSSGRNLE